jgi:hypothetical protein
LLFDMPLMFRLRARCMIPHLVILATCREELASKDGPNVVEYFLRNAPLVTLFVTFERRSLDMMLPMVIHTIKEV